MVCDEPNATITPVISAPTTGVISANGSATGSANHDSTITVALGAVIGVLVVLQIITLIGCGVVARRRNTNGNYQR